MSNLGHVQFLNVDGEWWIGHWEWTVPFGYAPSTDIGRIYAVSQMTWIEDERVDFYVPVANGPSLELQALPSVFTGYRNVAPEAKVTATNAKEDTVKYVNDGHVVTMIEWGERELSVSGKTQITFTFDTPKAVRGLLIYNSYWENFAFADISSIQFELAKTPDWRKGGTETECFIKDLGFNQTSYYPGTAAIATFDEILVNKITITIDSSRMSGEEIRVSDIQILGK
jgi:hypothetical protein